jgi:hypothetical protein
MTLFIPGNQTVPDTLAKMQTPARSISRHKLHHQFAQSCSRSVSKPMQQFSSHGAVARFCATALIGWKPYPLSGQGFYGSPIARRKLARSPARRSRDGRETSGKKSGEISRVISAQRPGNGRTVATAMPPNVRQDDSQDNLPCAGLDAQCPRRKLARQLANSRATAAHLASQCNISNPAVMFLTMTFKNYEHTTSPTNARS